MKCTLDIPYPPVEVTAENAQYAKLLSRDYAGIASELTAIGQYVYQEIVVQDSDKELSSALECISQVEMHHMDILGNLIFLLGGDPRLGECARNRFIYWDGHYPVYSQNPTTVLREDIAAEQNAIATYKKRLTEIADPKIQKNIERIIMDEEEHLRIFKCLLAQRLAR